MPLDREEAVVARVVRERRAELEVRPALKRFASGRRWKTLTKPDVVPKNVSTWSRVETESCCDRVRQRRRGATAAMSA